jgi:Flp pilus assembly protein TadG
MTQEGIHSFMAGKLRCFAGDEHAVSAIEFALLLPLMITLYLGGVEVSQAVSADRKATLVAHTVGDLVAQMTNATTAAGPNSVDDVLAAASTVAYPLSGLRITVSSVCIDATGQIATIAWSRATQNATARSGTVTSSIDSRLMGTANAGTSLIWGEASYDYRPTVGWTITGVLTMSDKSLSRPRQGKSITLDGAHACP